MRTDFYCLYTRISWERLLKDQHHILLYQECTRCVPDVIVCVWKLLQLSVSPPQIFNLLLQSLQLFFSSTHFSLFLISDQLCHLRAASLNGADQISKDPLTVLHCCLCRALLGHTEREASESVHSLSSYCCLTACSPQWASVGLKELQHWLLTDWLEESPNRVSNSSSAASSCSSALNSPCEIL